ncbi:MAG: RraA family protein [Gaiellales bacterium]
MSVQPIATADLSDAAGGGIALDPRIRPMWHGACVQGPAFTVQTPAGQHPAVKQALEAAAPGDVIVIDGAGSTERALWGDRMSARAQERGIAGVVIFGACRDVSLIEALAFPVFAITSVPTAPLTELDGQTGVAIACAGRTVAQGDLVVGDADGVVVVPKLDIERVLASL